MISAIILLAAWVPAFEFQGGNDSDLVAALANQLEKPCILLASPDGGNWKKCKMPSYDDKDFQRLIKFHIGLEVSLQYDGGVAPSAWPWGLVHKVKEAPYVNGFKVKPKDSITLSDDRITFQTRGDEALSINDLLAMKFSKKLRIHRFYRTAFLRMSVKNASEQVFLKTLATALGARLTESKDEFFLDVDEKAYRRRAIAAWKMEAARQRSANDEVLYADAAYMVEMLSRTTDQTIKKAFKDESRDKSIGTQFRKGTPVYKLAYDRVNAFVRNSAGTTTRDAFRRVVDPDQPVWGLITVEGDVACLFYNTANNHCIRF